MKKLLSLLLALCFVVSLFALSSCGKDDKAAETTATEPASESETAEVTTVEATTDKWEVLAPKITMLSAKDRALRIEYSVKKNAEKSSKNEIYLQGPDTVEDGVTPEIQVMIYDRNKAAENLLGVTITYIKWDYAYGEQAAPIDVAVRGNAADAPDLFINMIYDLNKEIMNSAFMDVISLPGSFFDFNAKGWLWEWMQNQSFTGDRAYILGSDYFLDVFRAVSLLPFNMTMMDANAVKLAPAIIGLEDTLGQGEDLTTRFFDLVETGGWTWDVLGDLCEAIWVDKDGNEQDSIYDQLGIIADTYGGINAASFIYSCGEKLIEDYKIEDPSSDHYQEQWLRYPADSTSLNRIFDAVKSVFEGAGSLTTSYTFSGNTPETPGAAYHHTKFASSELLFAGACLLGALEDDAFQNMTDLYSVVPFPKVNVDKEYNSVIVNQADAGVINVNAGPRKARALSAFLQYCTENSPAIRNEFLKVVTKYKTTTYNQGTDRMLEIIYDAIRYDRDKTVEDLINADRNNRWHAILKTDGFTAGSDYIASRYESLYTQKTSALNSYLERWYTLPKAGD